MSLLIDLYLFFGFGYCDKLKWLQILYYLFYQEVETNFHSLESGLSFVSQ